ncbi:MAG: FeoA family protein [candidate division WOR-3 bacterium]
MRRIDLTQMKENEKGIIVELLGGCGFLRRLEVLGIRKGKEVKKISKQVLGGPVIIQVGNTQVALGCGMARKIIVEIK